MRAKLMAWLRARMERLAREESGASAVEYVLLVGLVGLAIIAGATSLGNAVNTGLTQQGAAVTSNAQGPQSGS